MDCLDCHTDTSPVHDVLEKVIEKWWTGMAVLTVNDINCTSRQLQFFGTKGQDLKQRRTIKICLNLKTSKLMRLMN